MIYTVTFNPALDYVVKLNKVVLGQVNRTQGEAIYYGGKGINVSIVLHNLGIPSKALGFVAGFTGKEIEDGVRKLGIDTDFIHLKEGLSRINVKIKAEEETEINSQGPCISNEEIDALYGKLKQLKAGDVLVLAGAIPSSLPSNMYESILESLSGKGIEVVVDATKDLLLKVLKYHPFLIKPNNYELGEMFGVELKTEKELEEYAGKLQDMGARNVLVSMAGDGAILVTEQKEVYRVGVPTGKVVNSVGAGDSMVAGFVASYSREQDYRKALLYGAATGSATAFSEGLAEQDMVEKLLKQL